MLPIELAVHAVVVRTHLSYPLKVLLFALTATALVIRVAEPSVMRSMRTWLHAPALRHHQRFDDAPTLWRARVHVSDTPGALENLSRRLAKLEVNIMSLRIHHGAGSSIDEFVLAAPAGVGEDQLLRALILGGGTSARVWPSTALALADGQTKALSLACRVAQDPAELQHAVADLLTAELVVHPPIEGPFTYKWVRSAENPVSLRGTTRLHANRRPLYRRGIRTSPPIGRTGGRHLICLSSVRREQRHHYLD